MYRAKNHNSEPKIHLKGNSEFSESSKLPLWPFFNYFTYTNEKSWYLEFHSSLTMNNGTLLIWYFRSHLYVIVSNMTHFLIPFVMEKKKWPVLNCFICTDTKSRHLEFHSLLALNSGKLVWYFKSLWYAIVSNMIHFYILFSMREKNGLFNYVFHLYWCKIKTFVIFTARWLWIMGN